jgi:hypothetical protein
MKDHVNGTRTRTPTPPHSPPLPPPPPSSYNIRTRASIPRSPLIPLRAVTALKHRTTLLTSNPGPNVASVLWHKVSHSISLAASDPGPSTEHRRFKNRRQFRDCVREGWTKRGMNTRSRQLTGRVCRRTYATINEGMKLGAEGLKSL